MVWPENPQSLADIPHLTSTIDDIVGNEDVYGMTPQIVEGLCSLVASRRLELEQVTQGDQHKEQIIGSALMTACAYTKNRVQGAER